MSQIVVAKNIHEIILAAENQALQLDESFGKPLFVFSSTD